MAELNQRARRFSLNNPTLEQTLKSTLALILRFLLLTVVYFVAFTIVAGLILPHPPQSPTATESQTIFTALLVISLLNTAVVTYLLGCSQWGSLKLVVALWVVLFGVTTVMPQIETAVFIRNLPPGFLPRLILNGFVFSFVFSMLAVTIFKKWRSTTSSIACPQLSLANWIVRLSFIAVVYVILYFSFGYFIAWQNPAVVAYYGGTNSGSFIQQMTHVIRDTPWLVLLQIFRALLWTALAIPVIRMMTGAWWEAGLAVAFLFSVVMNTQLLLPNPLMPPEVRMTHLVETATSNFLFGWLLVVILRPLSTDTLRYD
ncbi:MAG: hypothetical protein C5B55_10120 [Blastocatellia bacterium]|nr:MAG: hypothetical protein C5B55_10120 [Blastocatellia bacterium]